MGVYLRSWELVDSTGEAEQPHQSRPTDSMKNASGSSGLEGTDRDRASMIGEISKLTGNLVSTAVSSLEVVGNDDAAGDPFDNLPEHVLVEVLVRIPMSDWHAAACTKKRWAALFKSEGIWQIALARRWPQSAIQEKWPGPIGRGSSKRRYIALHASKNLLPLLDGDVEEVAGHVYLYLKEQLESSSPSISYGLLHGTVIDQFLACKKAGTVAQDLASKVWLAVIDNLDETERTFSVLLRIAEEWEVFLPYPYSKLHAVQWRLHERLFTDFRDCLLRHNYYEVLTRAKYKFELIPATWLGF